MAMVLSGVSRGFQREPLHGGRAKMKWFKCYPEISKSCSGEIIQGRCICHQCGDRYLLSQVSQRKNSCLRLCCQFWKEFLCLEKSHKPKPRRRVLCKTACLMPWGPSTGLVPFAPVAIYRW